MDHLMDIVSINQDKVNLGTGSRGPAKAATFTASEESSEELKLLKIHAALAESGAVTSDVIFARFDDFGKSALGCDILFNSASELQSFIETRSHVFLYDSLTSKIHNRPFQYSQKMVGLINFLDRRKPFTKEQLLYDVLYDVTYGALRVGDEIDLKMFLFQHRHFLIEKEGLIVVSQKAVASIPSLSAQNLLPKLDPDNVFWDKSNMFDLVGYVVSSMENYCKVIVLCGPYREKTVYILGKNVGRSHQNLGHIFPIGTMVFVKAHLTYNAKNDFSAVEIRQRDQTSTQKNFWKIRRKDVEDVIMKANTKSTSSAPWSPSSSHVLSSQLSQQQIVKLRLILDAERLRIRKVDSAFTAPVMQDTVLLDRVLGFPLFELSTDFVDFVLKRPHLYEVDEETVRIRALAERDVLFKFIGYLNEHRPFGVSVLEARTAMKRGEYGEILQNFSIDEEEWGGMLKTLDNIMTTYCDTDGYTTCDRIIALNGSVHGMLFIPGLFINA